MALEDLITKLIAALDANTAAHKGSTGGSAAAPAKPAGGTVAAAKPKAAAVDFDTLKAAGSKVMDTKGRPFAKKLIKDVGGAAELASVKPEKFAALLKAFEAALAETEEPAADEEEDEDGL